MSILSTNHRLISIGESYSAGSGIDITDQVISVTGDVMPYRAGDNIDIQDHVISGKDWTQDITDASSNAYNETTAWVHDNYANSADVSYLSGVVDNKLDTSAWSSVSSNFATEDYVIMADNITYDRTTGYVENQQFAKESACQSAFEQLNTNKLDASSFTDWQNGQYSTDLQTIEGQIANKLDTSSFSEASGDFQPRGDYVERDTVYSAIESATSGKLDVSSFASVSSDFLTTSFGISESATWNDVSETVQTNSASWADGGTGDEEVNSFVYNNSATINEVNTAYQQYSASYQPSGNYIPYTAYNAINGYYTDKPLTVKGNLLDRTTTVTDSLIVLLSNDTLGRPLTHTTLSNYELNFSGRTGGSAQVDLSSINKWNEVSTTVQSNSAQWAEGGTGGDEEVNSLVHTNSATWNTVIDKLDTTAQVVTGYTTATLEGINAINSLNGKPLISWRTQSAMQAGVADKARYDYEGNNLVDDHNSLTSLKDVVQSNSANWGNEAISSYTSAWSTDVPPYGSYVINSLNGKYLSAYISRSAENAATAHIADLATFASTVNETKLENDGFVKNLSSEYGTISVVRNTIESTNSAISRIGKEGFVSSFQDEGIGPTLTANFSWDKSLPNTTFNFTEDYASKNTIITYSSNTNLTGEVTVTSVGTIPFSVEVPNATELNVWANDWVQIINNVASASDSFETVVGELAWASALPTYEYDITNKISAINGSAIAAGGSEVPTGTMNVSGLEYNAVGEISAYGNSAIAQYGAEKQWLVHDDTLVHLSNSAQYALGVNVSALQRLMGIDETVLWSASTSAGVLTANLSEPLSSFNTIEVYSNRKNAGSLNLVGYTKFKTDYMPEFISLMGNTKAGNNETYLTYELFGVSQTALTYISGTNLRVQNTSLTVLESPGFSNIGITRVIGIGRKA